MTERNFSGSQSNRMWFGVVANVDDPDKEGRVQVRIHGRHDDEQNIPNSSLPWSKPLQDITSAAHNKIGKSPVGAIVGTSVFGMYLDEDQQYPIHLGTISKAGDSSSTETAGGSESLIDGTNSTPPGSRLTNNSTITRNLQNIKQDDQTQITYPTYSPPQQTDSSGQNITQIAIANTKYSSLPSVASVLNPVGSILQQLQKVDPQNKNAVLPNAIPNFIKILDLNAFSSSSGSLGILGQAIGSALSSIASSIGGISNVINSMESLLSSVPNLSSNAQQALVIALQTLNNPTTNSLTVQNVINLSLQQLIDILTPLIQNGTLTAQEFEYIISLFLQQIQDNGTQATLGQGATQSNIFNMLSTLLPTISGMIENSLNIHFPPSVLNIPLVTQALQKFSMNQAILKAPNNGKKALAMAAVDQTSSQNYQQILNTISSIPGISSSIISAISKLS